MNGNLCVLQTAAFEACSYVGSPTVESSELESPKAESTLVALRSLSSFTRSRPVRDTWPNSTTVTAVGRTVDTKKSAATTTSSVSPSDLAHKVAQPCIFERHHEGHNKVRGQELNGCHDLVQHQSRPSHKRDRRQLLSLSISLSPSLSLHLSLSISLHLSLSLSLSLSYNKAKRRVEV